MATILKPPHRARKTSRAALRRPISDEAVLALVDATRAILFAYDHGEDIGVCGEYARALKAIDKVLIADQLHPPEARPRRRGELMADPMAEALARMIGSSAAREMKLRKKPEH